jgi:hypothetical protein
MKIYFRLLAVATLGLLTGCGGPPTAKLVSAKGIVTIDDKPADGIMVQLIPKTLDASIAAPSSQGISGEDGQFDLYTMENEPGAVAGSHTVSLFDTKEERAAQGQRQTNTSRLAPKYAMGAITTEVVAGQPIEIKATSK